MKKINSIKRIIFSILFAFGVVTLCNFTVLHASAAEAKVRFGSTYYEKNQGDRFPMGIYVENSDGSATGIGSYHVEISFNSQLIKYSDGATSIQQPGLIVLEGVGDGNQNKTMIYFEALYGGSTNVTVTSATVYTTDGEAMSVSYLGAVPVNISGNPPEDMTDVSEVGDADSLDTTDSEAGSEEADEEAVPADMPEETAEVDEVVESEDIEAEAADTQEFTDEAVSVDEVSDIPASETPTVQDTNQETSVNTAWLKFENDYLKYIIIGIAAIVCIIILIVAIRTAVRVGVHRHKLDKMMKNGSAEQDWAFEFDTIDDDKDASDEWKYDSSVLDEEWIDDSNSPEDYSEEGDGDANGGDNKEDSLDDVDFLFEFNSTPGRNK